jgi:hypothetical protein
MCDSRKVPSTSRRASEGVQKHLVHAAAHAPPTHQRVLYVSDQANFQHTRWLEYSTPQHISGIKVLHNTPTVALLCTS